MSPADCVGTRVTALFSILAESSGRVNGSAIRESGWVAEAYNGGYAHFAGVNMRPANAWKIAFLAASLLAALGCQQLMNQQAAVQKAIQDHLAERTDLAMNKMTMEVQQVNVNGDKAQAEVVFSISGDPQSRMSYHYELHREGGRWLVDGGRPTGSPMAHPQMGQSGMGGPMPGGSGNAEPLNLPEGHPPVQQMNPSGENSPPSSRP
jgi:hypothetical protein